MLLSFFNVDALIRQRVDADCCVNTVNEKNPTATNLVNCGAVIRDLVAHMRGW